MGRSRKEASQSDIAEAGCYFAQGNGEDASDPEPQSKDEVELVVFTASMMEPDADEEQVAYLAQREAASFIAWNRPKKGGKGKGKGKGKFKKTFRYSHYSFGRPPNKRL